MFRKVIIIVLCFLVTSCSSEMVLDEGLSSITVHPDGTKIVYAWTHNGTSSIYSANIDGFKVKKLLGTQDGLSFFNPRFSSSGKKIVFNAYGEGSVNSAIWMMDEDGNGLKQLTDSLSIKTEAILSLNEDTVFFVQAHDYKRYSSIGRKAAHNYDIYSLALDNGSIKVMTRLGAYGLYYISNFSNHQLMFNTKGSHSGLFILDRWGKGDSTMKQIAPNNKGENSLDFYSRPLAIDSNNLICTYIYELLLIDLNKNFQTVITRSPIGQFGSVDYNKINGRVYFTTTSDLNSVFSIKLDGGGLTEIPLNINVE